METLNKINSFVWGTPTLLLIFFCGVILSVRTNFFTLKNLKPAAKLFFKGTTTNKNQRRLTPLQSASTALSATMGTGNIVGVAGGIALGGPGAVFWMWVSAAFCMTIKFAEIALSIRYREQNQDGSLSGGVMYYIKNALPNFFAPLGTIFCICGVAAAFGVGNMTQINTMSLSVGQLAKTFFSFSPKSEIILKLTVGIICSVACVFILKNDGSIGRFCEKTIPLMTIIYICITVGAIAANYTRLPSAIFQIFVGAFSPKGITGGAIGSAFLGVRFGMSRGVFSNEAGLGTAPTAYACSDGDEISLGLMGVMEVFIDTVLVCTLTALTLLCAGNITYGVDTAANLTLNALTNVYGKNIILIFCPVVCLFAFSSTVGWGLYGAKFISFLFGETAKKPFLFLFTAAIIPASVFRADAVWVVSEILNGLMAIPNIIALLFLNAEVSDMVHKYNIHKKDTV